MIAAWLGAFALSHAIEIPVVLLATTWAARAEGHRLHPARVAGLAFVATAFTHPIVWFVIPRIGLSWTAYLWTAELFAWLAEAAFYRTTLPLAGERALLVSLAANGASFAIGLWLLG